MNSDKRYVKSNVTPESNKVLRLLAAERGQYIYEVVDDVLRKEFPEYFEKIRCWMIIKYNKWKE